MAERICPHCGKQVPETAMAGICPECMLNAGMASHTEGGDETKIISPPPKPEEIASLFPQLEILECLGRGGMGAVYKARQPKLNRFVALKILARDKENDSRFAERFMREAQALARLNYPNIVTVYDFGEVARAAGESPLYYLLMEFVDGLNLRQLMRERNFKPEEALKIVPRICEALQFAHEQGIVHRDIKPENILLDKTGRVKIADFGIAKILGDDGERANLTAEQQVIGTPHYMAPEQVERPRTVDHRADIFSLGVVFYEMLTGELPLGKFQPPSRKVHVDVRLDEVVLHALEKEPDRRYQRASDVKTDVETIAESSNSNRPETVATSKTKMGPTLPVSVAPTRWITIARWAARILGTLLLIFYGIFILTEGLPSIASQPQGVQLNFIALGLMLAGFAVGWRRDGAAALLIAVGWVVWQVSEARIRWDIFQTPLPVAALYGFCWWASRGRKTGVTVVTIIFLGALLGLGNLFVPTNIFLNGLVLDSRTGQSVPNAELQLNQSSRGLVDGLPHARSDANGRFRLYVGWYKESKEVTISAAGYTTVTTNLGSRPLGVRSLSRNFLLQPKTLITPPVVVQTIPESGAVNIDSGLNQIRVTFSKPMQDGTWSWAVWNQENFPEMIGAPRYLSDGRTCVRPVKLEPGRVYAVWINDDSHQQFKDTEGTAAVPYLLIFETHK